MKVLPVGLLQRTRWLPFHRRMHELDAALFALIESRRQAPAGERGECVPCLFRRFPTARGSATMPA